MRYLSLLCLVALVLGLVPTTAHATTRYDSAVSTSPLNTRDLRDLLTANPAAATTETTAVRTPSDLLRAWSNLTFHTLDIESVEPDLRATAQEWNRIVASGMEAPTYAELLHKYNSNEAFRRWTDTTFTMIEAALSCTGTIQLVVTALPFWLLITYNRITYCPVGPPTVAGKITCLTTEIAAAVSNRVVVLNWIVDVCVPLAPRTAVSSTHAAVRPS